MTYVTYIDMGLALTAVMINAAFALLILTRTSLAVVYITFLLNCLAAMIWNFGDFMAWKTSDCFWFYFSLIGTGMIPAVMFHFITALTDVKKHRMLIAMAYLVSFPLALSSPLALKYPEIRSFVDSFVWNAIFLVLFIPLFVLGIFMLVAAIRRSSSKEEIGRLRYFLIAYCIAALCTTDLLQGFKALIPPLGHLGSVIYCSVIAIGIFRHRAAYDLLAEMRTKLHMLNELAAGIAHELRNPLSSVKSAAALLQERSDTLPAEKTKEYLCLISEEIERLDGILSNYHHLIRPVKIERESVRINAILERTVALMRLNGTELRIELNLSPEIPLCMADPQTLKQVFINLIINAQEACGPEGMLQIKTEYRLPFIRITFKDSGKGVPADILPRMFEPFVSTKAQGMGLGLAICKRLIDLNEGTIEVENEKEGARFTICLPAADESQTDEKCGHIERPK
jgi:signal transduction histidine kinase